MRADLFLAFSAFSIAYALWKGGKPERITAVLLLVATLATVSFFIVRDFTTVSVWLALVDGLLMVALIALAMAVNRLWPIPLAACQVASVLGHLTKMLAPDLVPLGYAFLITFWSWPIMGILIFGTWCHHQRIKAGCLDRPWKRYFRPTPAAPGI